MRCRWLYKNTYVTPNAEYLETPVAKVLAARPTCQFSSMEKASHVVRTLYEWFEFILCLPFKLDFQGNWRDHPQAEMQGFVQLYSPLFQVYSPAMGLGLGYLYGAILLLQKVLVIYCIGTTVKKVDLVEPGGAHLSLWGLAAIHLVQVLFIITQLPFNERFENIVQMVVTFNQGAFFVVLATEMENPGELMNNLNLVAMAVVMAASAKVRPS